MKKEETCPVVTQETDPEEVVEDSGTVVTHAGDKGTDPFVINAEITELAASSVTEEIVFVSKKSLL